MGCINKHTFLCAWHACKFSVTSNYVRRGHQANEKARNANGSVKCNACKKISSKLNILSANVFFFIPFVYFLFVLFCLHSRAFNLRLPLLLVSISVVTVEMFFLKIRLNSLGVCKTRTGYLRMADADRKMRIEKCGRKKNADKKK